MDTLDVIEQDADAADRGARHRRAARAKTLATAFAAQRHVQDVMVFLHGHGVSAAFAARIVKRYGKDAINVVRANPYRLAHEVWGIGFRTADAIAEKLGIARDAPERLEAGLLHALETGAEDGHMHLPDDELIARAAELLAIARRAAARRGSARSRRRAGRARGARRSRRRARRCRTCTRPRSSAAALLAELVEHRPRAVAARLGAAIHAFEARHRARARGRSSGARSRPRCAIAAS